MLKAMQSGLAMCIDIAVSVDLLNLGCICIPESVDPATGVPPTPSRSEKERSEMRDRWDMWGRRWGDVKCDRREIKISTDTVERYMSLLCSSQEDVTIGNRRDRHDSREDRYHCDGEVLILMVPGSPEKWTSTD